MRIVLLLLAVLALPPAALAHTQTRSPATCITFDLGGGNPAWANPDRAQTSNNSDASANVNDNQTTDALVCYDYGFAIPAGATVLGIVVNVERSTSAGGSPRRDALMVVLKAFAAAPADRSTTTNYTGGDVVEPHGGATDLWGTTWTPAEINDIGFGAGFAAQKAGATGGSETVFVDHVEIEVHYSEPPAAPSLVSPADGAVVATSNPTFTWTAAADPDGDTVTYQIQADDSGCGFASPELDQSGVAGTSHVAGGGLANATYCWRVRAIDEHGLAGPWSTTRNVTVNAPVVTSQTGSPAGPGDCTNQGGIGTEVWSNTGNAISDDGSYATVVLDGDTSNWLRCLNYSFAIPAGATILGIELRVERRSNRTSNGGSDDAGVRLVKGGAIQPTDYETDANYGTATNVVETYGGPNDLWGNTWTPADINAANFGAAFAATKPSGGGAAHTVSVDFMSLTVYYSLPVVVDPGSFNAFETATAAGAITGVVTTRVAGVAFSLDVVAISGGAQLATFSNDVTVELLGNTALGTPLDADNCPTSFTVVQTVSPAPIAAGRSTVNFAAVPNAWRDVRVRVRYPVGAPTVTSCSTDNFAVRPASFTLSASDGDWETAGTARALTNVAVGGGVVHKAGRPFTLRASPAPVTATNYDGSPTVSALACTLPAGCANGTLSVGAFASVGGIRQSDTASYSEAGAFDLTLVDQSWASVDSGDGTPASCAGYYVCQSAALAVGRFVPDRFALSSLTAPELQTFGVADAACSVPPAGPRRSFTYVGQPFGYATTPSATVTAQNAAGGTTTNYRGALWKLAAAGVSQSFANTPVLPLDTALIGAPTLTETAGTGTGTLTANASDRIAFARDATTPGAPFNADLALTWTVQDTSESGAGQGVIGTAAALVFGSIGFDAGAEFRYGRLRLANANGSQLVALPVPMETQYWIGAAGFVTNAADHCTSVATASIALGSYAGNLAAGETTLGGGGTFTGGRRTLSLSAPGSGNDGSVTLTANLGATQPYLQGNWTGALFDDDPTARATFGIFRGAGEVIYMRENY
jgi:hypothetical protein